MTRKCRPKSSYYIAILFILICNTCSKIDIAGMSFVKVQFSKGICKPFAKIGQLEKWYSVGLPVLLVCMLYIHEVQLIQGQCVHISAYPAHYFPPVPGLWSKED